MCSALAIHGLGFSATGMRGSVRLCYGISGSCSAIGGTDDVRCRLWVGWGYGDKMLLIGNSGLFVS